MTVYGRDVNTYGSDSFLFYHCSSDLKTIVCSNYRYTKILNVFESVYIEGEHFKEREEECCVLFNAPFLTKIN
jgi:hypothetical protein